MIEEFKITFPNVEWKLNDNGVFMIDYSPEIHVVAALSSNLEEQAQLALDVMAEIEDEDANRANGDLLWKEVRRAQPCISIMR